MQIKQISIVDFLLAIGIRPTKETTASAWYHAPYREDEDPSFKVNKNRNIWYDFATAKSGDIIDLAVLVYRTQNISKVLKMIEQATPAVPLKARTFMPHPSSSSSEGIRHRCLPSKTCGYKRWHPCLCYRICPSEAFTLTSPKKNAGKRITPAMGKTTMPSHFPMRRAAMRYVILIIKGVSPRKRCH